MYWEGDALDYYLNPARGRVRAWGDRFAVMAWEEWLTFDPIAVAERVTAPARLVTGPETATPGGAEEFARRLRAPHDVVSLPGTQFHFYDDPATVERAAAAAVEHFRRTLGGGVAGSGGGGRAHALHTPGSGAASGDPDAVRGTVTRLLHAIDGRRWDAIPSLLAGEVTTDYTSLFGGEVQRQPGATLADAWRTLLAPLQATQHLLGPLDVEVQGATATAECHVRGYHVAPRAKSGPEWMIAGHYVFALTSADGAWRIAGITLQTYYQTGNARLLEEAAAR
jgi:hypothetical protein